MAILCLIFYSWTNPGNLPPRISPYLISSHLIYNPSLPTHSPRLFLISPKTHQHPFPFHKITNSQLSLLPHSPHPQPLRIFLQNTLIMIFPKLFRGIFTRYSFQDLGSAWMFVYESSYVVDVWVDYDVYSFIGVFVLRYVGGGELFWHFELGPGVCFSSTLLSSGGVWLCLIIEVK